LTYSAQKNRFRNEAVFSKHANQIKVKPTVFISRLPERCEDAWIENKAILSIYKCLINSFIDEKNGTAGFIYQTARENL
jgi:hypothetical protein